MTLETTTPPPAAPPAPGADQPITCSLSEPFAAWLAQAGGSLAVTTYQAGKVALLSWDPQRHQTTLLLRHFEKPMGLAATPDARRLALATRHAVTCFADAPLLARDYLEDHPGKYAALYLPRATYHTGDLNVHDLAFDADGRLWLVNTRFGCLATLSEQFNFVPRWNPPFLSDLAPEDRCHLNGLAMVDGRPKYATCLGETDTPGGWRDHKATGGALLDVDSNEVILRGLAMPHSPRWHDGRLWLLNSGAGELCTVDPHTGHLTTVARLPGYLRGLAFAGPNTALVGLCQIREKHIFGGLPVQQRCKKLLCGVALVDLAAGQLAGLFEFTAGVHEVYDVLLLPNVHRPNILGTDKDPTRQAFTAPDFSYWLRPGPRASPAQPDTTPQRDDGRSPV